MAYQIALIPNVDLKPRYWMMKPEMICLSSQLLISIPAVYLPEPDSTPNHHMPQCQSTSSLMNEEEICYCWCD
jgi:hypothetical protein